MRSAHRLMDLVAAHDCHLRQELSAVELDKREVAQDPGPQAEVVIATLDAERKQILRRYQAGELDDEAFEQELMRLRQERERATTRRVTARQKVAGSMDGLDLEAVCDGVREWLREAAGEDVKMVADALDLQVSASKEAASLAGNLPVFTHHCTNMGVSAPPCVCAADRLIPFFMVLEFRPGRPAWYGRGGSGRPSG